MCVMVAAAAGAQNPEVVPAGSQVGSDVWLQIADVTEVGRPRVFDELVVFTYRPSEYTRYVAAAFEHERFQRLHVFSVRQRENRPDLFYLALPVSPTRESLRYRLIVDGVWIVDPNAPQTVTDDRGVTLGRVELREPPPYRQPSPVVHPDGTVTFYFSFDIRISPTLETVREERVSVRAFSDPRVYVVGTFNEWSPFADRLSGPDADGFYTIRTSVSEGTHHYYFLIEGNRILDPLNPQRAADLQTGTFVSRVQVNYPRD